MLTSSTYPTERQIKYACDLIDKKDLLKWPSHWDRVNAMDSSEYTHYLQVVKQQISTGKFTKQQVSKMIDAMVKLPDKPTGGHVRQREQIEGGAWQVINYANSGEDPLYVMSRGANDGTTNIVPRGSYALDTPGDEFSNDTTFFSVWISDDGTRWSVKVYASDTLYKLVRKTQYRVLQAISEDPAKAASDYGLKVGRCGICHRKLTNDISRERGIGPICAARYGW